MRLVDAVAAPLFGQGGAAGVVAVFEGMPRFVGAACAQVDAEHRLDIERRAPGHELVRAELVGLGRIPSSQW